MKMRVLSLFDGISCGMVALERAGIEVDRYVAYEVDKTAIKVSTSNYPNIEQMGDVFNAVYAEGEFDLLIGGSPCTYWSVAKTVGRETTSEGFGFELFMQYVRALKEVKPKYFLYENNYGMSKEIKEAITVKLGVEPILINSELVSAQSRKRYYWTNIPNVGQPKDTDVRLSDILEDYVDDKYFINTEKTLFICDEEVKKRKILYIGTNSQGNRVYNINGKSVTITSNGGGWGAKTGLYWIPCITPDRVKKRQNGRRFKENNAKMYTITAQDRHGVLTNGYIRKLSPVECERLQTLPDNYTIAAGSDSKRIQGIGNGWTVDVIAHILKNIK